MLQVRDFRKSIAEKVFQLTKMIPVPLREVPCNGIQPMIEFQVFVTRKIQLIIPHHVLSKMVSTCIKHRQKPSSIIKIVYQGMNNLVSNSNCHEIDNMKLRGKENTP